jgi:hypothetical protein
MNKVNNTNEGHQKDDCEEKKLAQMELDLHIAEYNALTTRCTYFTNIQNVVLSVLVIWTTVMIGLWIKNPTYLISWGTILGAQAFGIISAVLLYEEYNIIRYLESVLKPRIGTLIYNGQFWGYQSFLIKQRKESYKIWEFSTVILTGFIITVVAVTRIPWEWGDFLGFILNFFALYVFGSKTYSSAKIRWNHWKL